ncbi:MULTISPECIES: vWA domain-containing protein [Marinobacter]|uniref:vWA domain-containing protein n=1 Tax=Marinobacter TaxID=2742 RepID=UPI00124902CC|nr:MULTISPECIES: VWA domain-containing protein [Marinobacter]MBL3558726.1 VWA domain-containing protein [Marinobacter sp. JB05H06]
MNQRQSALERALPIVAAAYGEQFGVRVVLSGSDAMTDGKTIVLPMLDNMSEMKDVLFGYLSHEAAHIRESSFDTLKKCRSEIEKSMTNLIEDIRIERAIQLAFPGTQFTLEAMENYIHERGWTPVPTAAESEASQLFRYLYHRLYGEFLDRQVYQPLIPESLKVLEQTFPRGFFVRLDGLLAKYMLSMTTSDDALKVARAILKALKDAEKEEEQERKSSPDSDSSQPPDPSPDGQGGSSDPNSNSENSSSVNGDTQGDSSPEAADQTDGPSDASGEQSMSDQDSAGDQAESDSSSDDSSDAGAGGTYERVMSEQDMPTNPGQQLKEDLCSQAREDQSGKSFEIDTGVGQDMRNGNGDTSELQAGILTSSSIRSRLLGLLQAETRQRQWLHDRGRRVDGRRLSRLAAGDTRVFIQRDEHKRPETSVHVLLDTSGSMSQRQEIANQATVSLALAISTIPKCDIAVSMFPGYGGNVSPMIHRGQPVRPNLGRFLVSSGGGTPLAEAMLYAARELSASHKPRQVLIVITDGSPNNGHAVNYLLDLMKHQIDTYAIGIGSNAVKSYFGNWTVINDVRELQSALFRIAGNVLDLDP